MSIIYTIFFLFDQVIYTLDTICEPNIMILAQMVLEIFCSQSSIGLQWESRKKKKHSHTLKNGHNSSTTSPTKKNKKKKTKKKKKKTGPLIFQTYSTYQISRPYASVTDAQTHPRTGSNQYAPSPSSWSWNRMHVFVLPWQVQQKMVIGSCTALHIL